MTAPMPSEPAGIVPPKGGAADKSFDTFAWLSERDPTWTSWSVGAGIGVLCVLFGARGIYAHWRGEAPDKERGVPALPMALGLFVFGTWVLWVFGISRLPG